MKHTVLAILVPIVLSQLPSVALAQVCDGDVNLHFALLSSDVLLSPINPGKAAIVKEKKEELEPSIERAVSFFNTRLTKGGAPGPAIRVCRDPDTKIVSWPELNRPGLDAVIQTELTLRSLKTWRRATDIEYWKRFDRITDNTRARVSRMDTETAKRFVAAACKILNADFVAKQLLRDLAATNQWTHEKEVLILINDCKSSLVSPVPLSQNASVFEALKNVGRFAAVTQIDTDQPSQARKRKYDTETCQEPRGQSCRKFFVGTRLGVVVTPFSLSNFVVSHELGHYLGLYHTSVYSDEHFLSGSHRLHAARANVNECFDWDRYRSGVEDTPPSLNSLRHLKDEQIKQISQGVVPTFRIEQALKDPEAWPYSCRTPHHDFSKVRIPLTNLMVRGGYARQTEQSEFFVFSGGQVDAMVQMAKDFKESAPE